MLNYSGAPLNPLSLPDVESLAKMLKVMAEPKRLAIIDLLMQGVQCNCELGDALDMPTNLISHHLGVLRKAGLVVVERDAQDARWVYYSIDRDALVELNRLFGVFFDPERIQQRNPFCGPQARVDGWVDLVLDDVESSAKDST